MLTDHEEQTVATQFGVSPAQVRRDHLISHLLSAVLMSPDGVLVRIQLLGRTGYPAWPTERREMVQRYADAPPAELLVPTVPAFAAWKTAAWADRAASRDLFDLKLLDDIGAIDREAAVDVGSLPEGIQGRRPSIVRFRSRRQSSP
ncbi:nucleotidyl transferase AbiEii/AbiGii toxin family protein [Nocardia sp. NPDC004722]